MAQTISKNLLGYTLLGYALGCLLLVIALIKMPLYVEPSLDEVMHGLTSSTQLPNFSAIEQTPERKQAFISTLLPLIELKNNNLLKTRKSILKLQQKLASGSDLTEKQYRLLDKLRAAFRVDHDMYPETAKAIDILLLRADMIPASMVLAQAAVESGWGTSRFAEQAHNLFGQWCYMPGCGLIPEQRRKGARHEVQSFTDIEASLSAYYHNINTHNAYRELRQLRAQLHEQDGALTGSALVAGLEKYSGRGPIYITELRTLIKVNDLEHLSSTEFNLAAQP